jgi:hypothetical protein
MPFRHDRAPVNYKTRSNLRPYRSGVAPIKKEFAAPLTYESKRKSPSKNDTPTVLPQPIELPDLEPVLKKRTPKRPRIKSAKPYKAKAEVNMVTVS